MATKMILSNELLVASMVDAQPESVVWFMPVWDGEGVLVDFEIRYCNQAAGSLLSVPKEAMIGQHLLHTPRIDQQTAAIIFQQSRQVLETGEPVEYTYFNEYHGRYFNALRSKVLDGVISVTRDITSVAQAEQRVRQQAELLNSILDASITPVFACEAIRDEKGRIYDFRFLKFNKMFVHLTGRREEELEGNSCLRAFPAAQQMGLIELKCTVLESGIAVRQEVNYKDEEHNGWFDVSISKLGEYGVVCTFTDITDSKRNKEALAESAQYLQNAIDSSQTGITVIEPVFDAHGSIIDFRYRVVNRTFSKYVGGQPHELAGQLLSKWFPLYKAQGTFGRYKEIYETGVAQRFDLHYVKDGYDVWADVLAKKQGGEILVTFHDYTTLKKAQLQQEALVADLQRSNAKLQEFAFAASHDLQEPLRKIHFFSDKLKTRYLSTFDNEGISMFERMEAATMRMRELITDLLTYSQIGMTPREKEPVDLNIVLQEVLHDLEPTIYEKKAQVTMDNLPVFKADKPQLQQLFQNLLSNSLKYAREGVAPFISIHYAKVQGVDAGFILPLEDERKAYHLVEVADNGIGFEQEHAQKIFNVFQRLHGRNEYSGTGVGLAIAARVVDNHEGHIMAVGQPGSGATFRILFPV